jgi:hypothetical protein
MFEASFHLRREASDDFVNGSTKMFIRWNIVHFCQTAIHDRETKASITNRDTDL